MTNDYVPVEKLLLATSGSIYTLAIIAAKRAMQLADGEKPLIERPTERPLDNALREIAEKKVRIKGRKK